MTELLANETVAPTLNAMDPGLSFLASQAAVELDNVFRNRPTDLGAVRSLAESLKNSTEEVAGSVERRPFMDTPTVSIVSNAIAASRSAKVRTRSELAQEAWRVANQLDDTAQKRSGSEEILKTLRAFCINLAQNSRSYRQEYFDVEPVHPYRS